MKLNKLYSWGEFKAFPSDFQVEYINNLIKKYGVGMPIISQVVFGLSRSTLPNHITSLGRTKDIKKEFVTGGGSTALAAAVKKGKAGDERAFAVDEDKPAIPPTGSQKANPMKYKPPEWKIPSSASAPYKPNEEPSDAQTPVDQDEPVSSPAPAPAPEPDPAPKPAPTEGKKKKNEHMNLELVTEDIGGAAAFLQLFNGKAGSVKIFVEVEI